MTVKGICTNWSGIVDILKRFPWNILQTVWEMATKGNIFQYCKNGYK